MHIKASTETENLRLPPSWPEHGISGQRTSSACTYGERHHSLEALVAMKKGPKSFVCADAAPFRKKWLTRASDSGWIAAARLEEVAGKAPGLKKRLNMTFILSLSFKPKPRKRCIYIHMTYGINI